MNQVTSPSGLSFKCPIRSPDLSRIFCHGETANKAGGPYKMLELFSPPRVSTLAAAYGLQCTRPAAFDLETGWDVFNAHDRAEFWKIMRDQEPDIVLM